ncbi:MAG: hypothetical protein HQK79_20730, partial [Desulfobacterales bacterium]|nr:hypothetical protein [Desulfobacterales bacterium]
SLCVSIYFRRLANFIPTCNIDIVVGIVFWEKIKAYFTDNYFQFIYQYLQKNINLIVDRDIEKWKRLFSENNLLSLLNDIYRNRLSKKGMINLQSEILKHDNWDDYSDTLKLFIAINPVKVKKENNSQTIMKNALSLGTKVLHTYNPYENPIIDDVILNNLVLKKEFAKHGIEFCNDLKEGFNNFAKNKSSYFKLPEELQIYLKNINIETDIPTMKMLDIALFQKI